MADRQMRLGALFYGFGGGSPVGWRHPASSPWGANDVGYWIEQARIAEQAKLDTIFFADMAGTPFGSAEAVSQGSTKSMRVDPMIIITAMAMATTRIGLAATASTSYWEPYNLARIFASIDHVSGGRAAWNSVTSDRDEVALNFGDAKLKPHDERYDRAEEFLDVVFGLWDSWEAGAELVDRESGVFFDPDKLHLLEHEGKYFKVRGPLNVSRTPQGRPVIAQAGTSDRGREFAARVADAIFTTPGPLAQSQDTYADIKARMSKYGRQPVDLKVLEGSSVTVAATEEEAKAKQQWLADHTSYEVGLWLLTQHMGVQLTEIDPDATVTRDMLPEVTPGSQALFDSEVEFILEHGTLRKAVDASLQGATKRGVVGSAGQVVDHLQERFEAGANDGYMLAFSTLPASLQDFADFVVPELQRRGLFRTEYEGTTLRENLGIPVPENRYTATRSQFAL